MKAFMIRKTLLALFVLFCTSSLYAQNNAAVVFLQIEPDARFSGMGNAGSAVADNSSAIFWNPAGLASQKNTELSLTHSNWLPKLSTDLFYEYLTGKYHVDGLGTFGAHVTFLNLGESERRDESNNLIDTFRSYDAAAGVSFGFPINERLSIGTGARFIYSNLDSGGGSVGTQKSRAGISAGVDLGVLYKARPINLGGIKTSLSTGFNVSNMGPKIQYADQGQSDPIPTSLRLGVASRFDIDSYNSITLVGDATKLLVHSEKNPETGNFEADPFYKAIFSAWKPLTVNIAPQGQPEVLKNLSIANQMTWAAGMEYWYRKFFAIRAGYFYEHPDNGNRNFLTLGAGIRQSIIGVDFSYVISLQENGANADTPRFSIILNL
ncbi:MAG: type IX secretion system outer membrane channel protein PorV [Rhodothermia bacterium]|nr:type IX secretion system outer membrane channel protein PorV [Rhodothermia bacterium]